MTDSDRPKEPIVPDVSEALSFEPVATEKPAKRTGRLLPVLILMTVAAGGGWYFMGGQYPAGLRGGKNVPIIRAEEGPVKVRPDTPGGMEVPDRDKLVYDRMGGTASPQVERLLPLPETPLSPPGSAPPESAEVPSEAAPPPEAPPEAPVKDAEKSPEPPPIIPTSKVPTSEDVLAVTPPPPAPPMPEEKSVEPVKPAAPPAPKPKEDSNSFRVQLAAVRTIERARSEWERLSKQHFKLLGGKELFVVKVDLGPGKGIFYRLRAGPIANEAAARGLCKDLAKRKVGCLVVWPGE